MDVGIDTHEFRPWHYDEIAGGMKKKSEAQKEGADIIVRRSLR